MTHTTDMPVDNPLSRTRILAMAAAAGLIPLNSTMIAVALPAISDEFGVSTATVSVLVSSYLVIMFVGQPIAGRLGDRVGSRELVQVALVGLAVLSAAAALSPTFWLLVAARGLQAVCATAITPGVQSLLTMMSLPADRGRVFGLFGSVMAVGAAAGPIVGGVLVQLAGWEAIFIVNVPIAIAPLFVIRAIRVSPGESRSQTATAHRIGNRVFNSAYAAQALSTFGQYALLLLAPLILDSRGWSAGSIGLALSTLTIGAIVMGPVGGRLGDQLGARRVATVGLSVATIGIAVLAIVSPDVESWLLSVSLGIFGFGLGATTPNLASAAMGSVPADRTGAAAGVMSTSRYVGSISATVAITILVSGAATGAGSVLAIGSVCLVAAVVAAQGLPTSSSAERPTSA